MRRISSTQGLPSNTVHDIVQDAQGYIWMGTSYGLCRFDGYHSTNLHNISCNPKINIEANIAIVIPDDSNHLIWACTSAGTVVCYNKLTARFVDYTGCGDHTRPYTYMQPTNGAMWLYGDDTGARCIKLRNGHFHTDDYRKELGNMPCDSVSRISEDEAGNVWIFTKHGAVVVPPKGSPHKLLTGRQLVAGTRYGHEMLLLDNTGRLYTFDIHLHNTRTVTTGRSISNITADVIWNGQWLIFTRQETVAIDIHNATTSTPHKLQLSGGMKCRGNTPGYKIIADTHGETLILSDNGNIARLQLMQNGNNSSQNGIKICAAKGNDNKLYIATAGNGLFIYNPDTHTIARHLTADPNHTLLSNIQYTVMADRDGNIWVSCESAGVTCISPEQKAGFRYMLPAPDNNNDMANTIRYVTTTSFGKTVVSTKANTMHTLSPSDGTFSNEIRTKARIYSYFTDSDGRQWLGTRGDGLYVDGIRYSIDNKQLHITSNNIYDIAQDAHGRVWIATWGGGLLMTHPKAGAPFKFKKFLTKSRDEKRIRKISIASNGRMWIATCGGLYTIDTRPAVINDNDFKRFCATDGTFPINNIICLATAHDGTLYAGGLGCGLIKAGPYTNGASLPTEAITKRQGLANNNIRSVIEDNYGYIWAGTEEGLSRINPHNNTAESYNFSPTLPGNVYSEGAVTAVADGTLLFGTGLGVLAISPSKPNRQKTSTHYPLITDIHVNGKTAYENADVPLIKTNEAGNKSISLSHNQNTVEIFFSNMSYSHVSSTFYMYRLDGVNNDWEMTSDEPKAQYSGLSPGSYTFRVRSMTANGQWSEDTTLDITILQPWWNTLWAWLIYICSAIALCGWLYTLWFRSYRLRHQMAEEHRMTELRLELFTQIAHEFRTPLSLIQGAAEKLYGSSDNNAMRQAVQTVRRGTARLLRQVNQLMDFRRVSTDNIKLSVSHDDIVRFIRDIADDFRVEAANKSITLSFVPFTRSYATLFDRRIIETIIYNLLSNAVKYTPTGGSITMRLSSSENSLTLSVEDSGPGLTQEQTKCLYTPFMHGSISGGGMGIGLYTAHRMAEIHGGTLVYSSAPHSGCIFSLTIPDGEGTYSPFETVTTQDPDISHQKDMAIKARTEDILGMMSRPMNDMTIAIIEDDSDMAAQIRTEAGAYFRTVCYFDGPSAVTGLMADPPALVICDVMLPGLDGYDVVRSLRRNIQGRNIPVIMLTSFDDEEHQMRAYRAGADDYMVKPCNFNLLMAKAVRLISYALRTETGEENAAEHKSGIVVMSQIDRKFIESVNNAVEKNLANPDFNFDTVAEDLGMGRTKFYGKMKELYGMTPGAFLADYRMKTAKRLLDECRFTPTEVSYKVGFKNYSYFSLKFKTKFGMAPTEYKKR